ARLDGEAASRVIVTGLDRETTGSMVARLDGEAASRVIVTGLDRETTRGVIANGKFTSGFRS
ncbi:MAG: hypothetical protein AAF563_21020, partial [Pseudomonadota bacterium]